MCPGEETMNLNFVENLVGLRVYPGVYGIYTLPRIDLATRYPPSLIEK